MTSRRPRVTLSPMPVAAADRHRHVPADRRRGVDGPRPRRSAPAGTRSTPPTSPSSAAAVDGHGGVVVRTEGDALFAVFPEAGAAVAAAVDAQRAIGAHDWPATAPIRVRIGLHSGEAHLAGDDYGGFEVNRAARIAAVGHGGQIVLSGPTADAGRRRTCRPARSPSDLGRFVLKDVPRPERLVQLDVADLPSEFPPLRAGRATVGNLDERLTSFIGRDRELVGTRRPAR